MLLRQAYQSGTALCMVRCRHQDEVLLCDLLLWLIVSYIGNLIAFTSACGMFSLPSSIEHFSLLKKASGGWPKRLEENKSQSSSNQPQPNSLVVFNSSNTDSGHDRLCVTTCL